MRQFIMIILISLLVSSCGWRLARQQNLISSDSIKTSILPGIKVSSNINQLQRFDGILVAVVVIGIVLCFLNRDRIGMALCGGGICGLILITLLDALRIYIIIAGAILFISGLGYFAYRLYNLKTCKSSMKMEYE